MRRRDEHGQTTVLIIGFAVVAMLMVAVVVDASAAYLRRSGLDSVADGAALAAAEGLEGSQVYTGRLGRRARSDPGRARRFVADSLRDTGAASRYPGLSYTVEAGTDRVVVHVTSPLDLPLTPPGWDTSAVIAGSAASVVVVGN